MWIIRNTQANIAANFDFVFRCRERKFDKDFEYVAAQLFLSILLFNI